MVRVLDFSEQFPGEKMVAGIGILRKLYQQETRFKVTRTRIPVVVDVGYVGKLVDCV